MTTFAGFLVHRGENMELSPMRGGAALRDLTQCKSTKIRVELQITADIGAFSQRIDVLLSAEYPQSGGFPDPGAFVRGAPSVPPTLGGVDGELSIVRS